MLELNKEAKNNNKIKMLGWCRNENQDENIIHYIEAILLRQTWSRCNAIKEKSVSGGQVCYLHTHSHSELAWRETEEDEEQERNGKVIMESGLTSQGWRREKM